MPQSKRVRLVLFIYRDVHLPSSLILGLDKALNSELPTLYLLKAFNFLTIISSPETLVS